MQLRYIHLQVSSKFVEQEGGSYAESTHPRLQKIISGHPFKNIVIKTTTVSIERNGQRIDRLVCIYLFACLCRTVCISWTTRR